MAATSSLSPTRAKKGKPPGSDDYEAAVALVGDNMLVPWYLMASYAYYVLDDPLLTDAQFDALCKALDEKWEGVQHRHKDLVDRAALKAGTCLMAAGDYPGMVVGAVERLLRR